MSFYFSMLSCLSMNSLKSAFYLLISVLIESVLLSLYCPFWVFYFLVFLFLSGILVVVVLITGLSFYSSYSYSGLNYYFLLSLFFFHPSVFFFSENMELANFYSWEYFWGFMIIFFSMYLLLIFMSLMLYLNGALRKM